MNFSIQPDERLGLLDTNAKKLIGIPHLVQIMHYKPLLVIFGTALLAVFGCVQQDATEVEASNTPGSLIYSDCKLVDVIEVKDSNTLNYFDWSSSDVRFVSARSAE